MKSIGPGLTVILAVAMLPAVGLSQATPGIVVQSSRTDHYTPESPWSHGKIFKSWIGHGGWNYNCDCEEDKRFSPYITWKSVTHCESQRGGIAILCADLNEVQTRIRAGKCQNVCWPVNPCPDCGVNCSCSANKCDQPGTGPISLFQTARVSSERPPANVRTSLSPPVPVVESRTNAVPAIVKPAAIGGSRSTGMLSGGSSNNLRR